MHTQHTLADNLGAKSLVNYAFAQSSAFQVLSAGRKVGSQKLDLQFTNCKRPLFLFEHHLIMSLPNKIQVTFGINAQFDNSAANLRHSYLKVCACVL